ncbi:MAG: hypothetical protein HYT87_18525, partial [Nitrospirae bacterium]|nr:hypothetical protein [Nitrospirota bacterium]
MAVRIDDTAPETTAEADEDMVSLDEEITFEFSCAEEVKADEASCKFKCNAADTEYIDCASPWTIKFSKLPSGSSVDGIPLAVRTHVAVKAINKDGYEDPTPADIEIVVIPTPECGNQTCELAESVQTCPQDCDTAAPDTFITSKPSSPTAVSFDKITYDCKSPNNTACTFECSQESSDYAECSPEGAFLYYLGNGPHTFAVRAKNSAGIADETPASVSWVVDMFGPTFAGLTRANKQSDGTSVLLGWAEATDNVSQPANLIYQICWSETKGQCAANFTSNYTTFAGATSHTVKGLSSTATYYFTAVAIDEAGNRSAIAQETEVKMAGGIITTVAGTTGGNSGDNGPATEARLWRPGGVAVDPNGILYIADTGNHRVRKVDPSGIITAVAGNGLPGYSGDGGKATEAWLWAPGGVAVDPNGNLYIADTDSHHIRKVDTSGNITTVAGNPSLLNGRYQGAYSGDSGKATAAKLNIPSGVAVDSNGNLYIADTGNHRIRKVDATTQKITTVAGNGLPGYSGDGGKATEASLCAPGGVAVDPNGNLYIADTDSH